jgi:hypothetical protein
MAETSRDANEQDEIARDWAVQLEPPTDESEAASWPMPVPPPSGRRRPHPAARDPMTELGFYIRRSRSFHWRGQRRLADRSGVSQSAIARLELGRAKGMQLERLVQVGVALRPWFPLGTCPHRHRCAWQPITLPVLTQEDVFREERVRLGLDTPITPRSW